MSAPSGAPTLLAGLRVVELSDRPAGWYAGAMAVELGAQVTAVRKPGFEPPERYLHLHHDKTVAPLDWSSAAGQAELLSMIGDADVLLSTLPPVDAEAAGLTYEDTRRANPDLVYVALTPFGLDGPYRDYRADELVLEALMGLMDLTGDPSREPLKLGAEIFEQMAGLTAFVAAEAALLHRQAGGPGRLVDVSMLEAAVSMMEHSPAIWSYQRIVRKRAGNWGALAGWGLYPALDGYVGIISGLGETYQRFRRHIGGALLEPRFEDIGSRTAHASDMNAAVIAYTSERTKADVYEAGQRDRLPFGYVCTVPELLDSPQLQARGFFRELTARDGRTVLAPGLPFRVQTGAPCDDSRPSTPLGQPAPPLAGIRVLDLGVVWAGPHCTRLLADMGAEVIKVEAPENYDPIRGPHQPASSRAGVYPNAEPGERPYNRHAYFNERNRNKLGVTIDVKRPGGRELLLQLAARCDVFLENFSAGTMARLGLGYEDVAGVRPDIVYLSMPAFGNTGPEAHYAGYGATSDQLSGLVSLTGYGQDDLASPGINLSDPVAGTHAASAVLAALLARTKTGRGAYIDLSHREATARLLGPELIEWQLTGEEPRPRANRHPTRAPHGVYPCRGDELDKLTTGARWLALSVSNDEEWRAACGVFGLQDERFATSEGRLALADELDALVSQQTRDRDADELMHALQQAGVPAADVRSADRLFADPQLRAREWWRLVDHPEAGAHEVFGFPWRMPELPEVKMSPAPCLSQHNHRVLRDLLGLQDEEIAKLEEQGVIGAP
jgi:crotonobetainyl-CoA:carnitine CoA-transferase CaiB-like acyl-CoA transferase